ncbi:methyl-accepting chemotaxis protein [Halobaculum magnesiiphilum]|uniref:HAMP domain-containing protein n=1 Tax=Halobaculum magnesiiphilum TaxID=1017351 RepID=A0A8T8WIX5_9EURY|nr:HAMP domain-containing methyl-accepting chemotaxis protein [Halobaculum magnesiiphilum]QZP39791.1 HAMP domain-containing protein [Halobaculum magnesiiphilum]
MTLAATLTEKYTRRIGTTLIGATLATLAFAAVCVASVRQTPGSGVGAVVALAFVFTLNLGLVTIVVGGNVGLELKRLIAATNDMRAGNLDDVTVRSDRRDEFGELATAFGDMRDSLREAMADSERARTRAENAQADAEAFNEELLDHADTVAESIAAVSDGHLDDTAPTETGIEAIDSIGSAYTEMTNDLSETVVQIRAFADRVDDVATSVRDDAATVESDQRRFATDLRDHAESIVDQADELESVSDEAAQLSAAIEEIASTADSVEEQAGRAAGLSDEGSAQAAETVSSMRDLDETITELAELVEALEESMTDVADSTALIEEISEQTNLLALNANIEAARSGADGDGFAVVAEEVKSLAEETRRQSDDIAAVIGRTQDDVDDVIEEMREAESKIDAGVSTATASGDTFEKLDASATDVEGSVTEVARATEDAAARTEEVTATVNDVSDHARRLADRGREIAAAAEETAETVGTMHDRAEELTDATATLRERLERFTVAADTDHVADNGHVASGPSATVATDGGDR